MNYSKMLSDIEDYISELESKVEDLEENLAKALRDIDEMQDTIDHLGN